MPPSLPSRTPIANDPVESLVEEFMKEKRKELLDDTARTPPRKRQGFVTPLLIAVCVAIWTAPSFIPRHEPVLSQETLGQGAKLTLYLASMRVRNYLETHKQLPVNLNQAGVDSAGIEYFRSTDSLFELSTRVQDSRLVYRSKLSDSLFLGPNLRIKGIS